MTGAPPPAANGLRAVLTRQIVRDHLRAFLEPYRTNLRVLDIGSGNSPHATLFPNRFTLDIVRKGDVQVIGDAHSLPFAADTFPIIISTEVLEHVPDPQRMIDDVRRVLQPAGRLLMTTRFIFPLHDTPGDYYRFTDAGLRYLFRNWSRVEVRAETGSWDTFGVLLQRMAFQCDFRAPKLVRPALLLAARLMKRLDWWVRVEYGNVATRHRVDHILASGWYVVAQK